MASEIPLVLINGTMVESWQGALRYHIEGKLELRTLAESIDDQPLLDKAIALISPNFDCTFPRLPSLALLQVPLSGVDQIELASVPEKVAVCNVTGHGNAVAEFVLMAILVGFRRFISASLEFSAGSWQRSSRTLGPVGLELSGKTIVIVGFGHIGRAVANKAIALGMNVIACNRTPIPVENRVQHYPLDRLQECVQLADVIVLSIELCDATRNIIDRKILYAIKQSAIFINVARGACVDEDALYEFYKTHPKSLAVLDTWYSYPRPGCAEPSPSRYNFSELGNVIMSPHISAWTAETVKERQLQIIDNLNRLLEERSLERVVYFKEAS